MAYSKCIPETASFPTFDSWWISLFESRGIDLTCGEYGILLNLAICGTLLAATGITIGAALIIGAWQDKRHYRRRMRRRHRRA